MKQFATLAAFFALLLLTGCAPAATGSGQAAYVALPAQDQADARATIAAADIAIQATREVGAQQTAVAVDATRAWIAAATAEAQEATRQAQATTQAMQGQQTVVALQMAVDEATRVAQAEQTAVAVTIAAEQAREELRAGNTLMLREAEAERMQSSIFWRNVFNGLLATLLFAGVASLLMIAGSVVARVRNLNNNPVRQYSDDGAQINILVVPNGLFGTDVRQIGRPSTVIPQLAAPSLPALPAPLRELPEIPLGHVLIAGPSDAGKSTVMRAILRSRQNVTVLDPHAAPGEWNAARVIGLEGDFDAIAQYMAYMQDELQRRMRLRGSGQQLEFDPLTVATDEMPAIVEALGQDEANSAWRSWVRQGRKFGLFVIVSTQSTRVKTLGISGEGDIVEQFQAVINLGSEAERKFRHLLTEAPRGTAVLEMAGQEPRVIRVPNVPAFAGTSGSPAGSGFAAGSSQNGGNGYAGSAASDLFRPHAGAPVVVEQGGGIDTPHGFVTAAEVDEILHYGRNMSSLRGVAYNVYGSTGGVGFYKARAVLDRHGVAPGA
jgi:hypothetical protein